MYPDKSAKVLDYLYQKNLKGHLDLSEYEDLEVLYCYDNELTSLDASNCLKLKLLNCSANQISNLDLSKN